MSLDQSGQPIVVNVGTQTDIGHKRALNEDSLLAVQPVFLVADGMGGHDAGEVASAAVVQSFQALVGQDTITVDDVASAIERANDSVAELSAQHRHGAGSTVTGIALVEDEGRPQWLVFNVGDSRVYRIFEDRLQQLTRDHSLVQELIDNGTLTIEQAAHSSHKNIITRAVGAEACEPDFWLAPVVTGERFLICSDGLSGEVDTEALHSMLLLSGSVQDTADALVRTALRQGGRDNVTVIVVDVVHGGTTPGATVPADGNESDASGCQTAQLGSRADDTTIPGRRRS